MICVDTSEYMRNGDVAPSRLKAQAEAVHLLAGAKTQANPESCVGVLTLAGKMPKVLVTPTPELGQVLNSLHGIDVDGELNIATGVQVAQLALKHRQNTAQRQRIVLFVGSPVTTEKNKLVKIGKQLKKVNVAVDIVSFGDVDANAEVLEAFHAAVNKENNSHLVAVPAAQGVVLSDVLTTSPVFNADGEGGGSGFAAAAAASAAAAANAGAGGGGDFEFGVDPSVDPELALALRVSMEEERARQEAAAKKATDEGGGEAGPAPAAEDEEMKEAAAVAAAAEPGAVDPMLLDDDQVASTLQQALAMSMMDNPDGSGGGGGGGGSGAAPEVDPDMDPELALALQMSMAEQQPGDAPAANPAAADATFMSSVLADLPGVDPNDPAVQAALGSLGLQMPPPNPDDQSPDDQNANQ